jgi:hypothetical protein
MLRNHLKSFAREEKQDARSAENTAETAKIFASVGAAVAGVATWALAAAVVPLTLPALAVAGGGYALLFGGAVVRHFAMERSYEHQKNSDAFSDAAEELK